MKWFVRIIIVLLILIVALVLTANFYLGSIVIKAAETAGPSVLGVPIKLEHASFRLLQGHVTLRGFVLGNPKGFKTDQAISVGEVTVDLDPKTLLSDTIVIKRIYVNAPDITYELGLGKSNIGRILEQASGPDDPEKKEEPSGKKVVIEDFLIENGRVRISATLAMGAAAPIPLTAIHLTDIGKDKQGASPLEVIKQVLGAIVGSVTKVVTGAVGLVDDGAKAVGGATVSAVEGTADVVGDGAKAVGGAVVDAGEAVGEGASKVLDGVTGIFKSDKPTNEPPAEKPTE
jgi:uncharacterized protein involved in outer membrane biogenesis